MPVVCARTPGLTDSSHPPAVLSRLSEQRSQGLFCDVTIVVEDVKFRAHRNVLAATCGYFRSAFSSPEMSMPGQVMELLDLRSDVFAAILNFIYSSRVEPSGMEDSSSLLAAGKRLGIPFLEKLQETERRNAGPSEVQACVTQRPPTCAPPVLKREAPRSDEPDCSRVPRITNAFSITEAGTANDPFTPLTLREEGHGSPAVGRQPASGPAPSMPGVEHEPSHTLSEHSYAVSHGHKASDLDDGHKGNERTCSRQPLTTPELSSQGFGPLKKRHRLRKALTMLDESATVVPTADSSLVSMKAPNTLQESSLAPLLSDTHQDTCPTSVLQQTEDTTNLEAEPPTLIPEDTPTVPAHPCPQCPEAFSNRVLLTIHMQIHKRRFVSHLLCKYCRRKFMHLKRLRNHEHICKKAAERPPDLEPNPPNALVNSVTNHNITETLPAPEIQDMVTFDSAQLPPLQKGHGITDRGISPAGGPRTYKCSVCKRAYVTLSSLKRHENVHSWQRAYPCHYCNKVFALAEYRTKHEIWHTGERRYQCIFCLETFMTYYILKNHQKSFHGIDPRLAVNRKSANGGLKSSVYPIKLYRLLPMKFRKRRYKTYSHTFSETDTSDQMLSSPLGSKAPSEVEGVQGRPDGVCRPRALFSMPVTFMATPKMVASEMPCISFDQLCAQSVDPCDIDACSPPNAQEEASLSRFANTGSSLITYDHNTPIASPKEGIDPGVIMNGDDMLSSTFKSREPEGNIPPFQNIPDICSFEGLSKLGDLSAAAQTIEAMANQLLLPPPEPLPQSRSVRGKTETYIAKPACPGPSVNSRVLPLCQITVKIGNEAIIRRKIKGSKLFPRRKKRRGWTQVEGKGQESPTEESIGGPSLRLRAEVTTSMTDNETYDDPADTDTDKLWRPYYSYKPKRKGKKLRPRHKREKSTWSYTRPLSPEADEDLTKMDCGPANSISAERSAENQRRDEDHQVAPLSLPPLNTHEASSTPMPCKVCGKKSETPASPLSEDGGHFICKSCTEDGSCFSPDPAARSLSSEKRYRCSFCPQRFLYLATKTSHEKKHLMKSKEERPECHSSQEQLHTKNSKHCKTEEGGVHEEREGSAMSPSMFTESRGRMPPEPWRSTCPPVKTEERDKTEPQRSHRKGTNSHKGTSLLFPFASNSFPPLPAEMLWKKPKKRKILARPRSFISEENRQGAKGGPSAQTNSQLTTRHHPTCTSTDPVTTASAQRLPKSVQRLCKEETLFHTHN